MLQAFAMLAAFVENKATNLIINVYQWNPHCNKVTKMSVISKVLMRRQDTARNIGHFEPHHGRVMDAILGCIEKTRQALPYARGGENTANASVQTRLEVEFADKVVAQVLGKATGFVLCNSSLMVS